MNELPQKELGIIFIINYPADWNNENDVENIKASFADFKNGIFNYGSYEVCANTDIYFVSSVKLDKARTPRTVVTRLEPDADDNRYDREDLFADYKSINLGDKDVLSTLLVSLTRIINAKEYIIFLYSHASVFGFFESMANVESATREAFHLLKKLDIKTVIGTSRFSELKSNADPKSFEDLKAAIKENYSREVNDLARHYLDNSFVETIAGNKENFRLHSLKDHLKSSVINIDLQKVLPPGVDGFQSAMPEEFKQIADKTIEKSFEENLVDYKPDMLTNSELRLALTRAFDNNILIIFNAGCFAMNVETVYTLRSSARFIAGAQSIMPPQAYDFAAIVNSIAGLKRNAVKSITDEDCKKIIADGMGKLRDRYEGNVLGKTEHWLKEMVITAIDTAKIEELKNCIDEFALYCFSKPQSTIPYLERDLLTDLSTIYPFADPLNFEIIDLKKFAKNIKRREIDDDFEALCDKIMTACDSLMVTDVFYGLDDLNEFFNGLSIFFPLSFEKAFNSYSFNTFYSPVSKMESSFSEDSYWGEFLYFYFKFSKKNHIAG